MKKVIASCLSLLSAVTLISSVTAYAEEYQTPTFYFGVTADENVSVNGDTVTISKAALEESGFTLNIKVFVDDPDLRSWYVSPKWKCASEYITLDNVFNPSKENPEFAYGLTNENGRLIYSAVGGGDPNYNTMYFTCQLQPTSPDRTTLIPLGETSDAYPLTNFDAVISSDIPAGTYEIYFLTESEDYEDQQVSTGSFRLDDEDKSTKSYDPIVRNLTIIIKDVPAPVLGDVNFDKVINPSDATLVLRQYAAESLKDADVLDEEQKSRADANSDSIIDPNDATLILLYYAYNSTGGTDSFEDFVIGR